MNEMNFDEARHNMVEQQIRTWTVLNTRVLDAIEQLPREDFVLPKYRRMAYSDIAIPLEHDQEMMHPKFEAHAAQAVEITPESKILEIGTGSGYLTALLASLGGHVDSVDIFPDFQKSAAKNLAKQNIENVTLIEGDASQGWGEPNQYDAIVITGSLPELPDQYKNALTIGGYLFAIIGEGRIMHGICLHRSHGDRWQQHTLFETEIPTLINAERPQAFIF